jgi:hypothetical protein
VHSRAENREQKQTAGCLGTRAHVSPAAEPYPVVSSLARPNPSRQTLHFIATRTIRNLVARERERERETAGNKGGGDALRRARKEDETNSDGNSNRKEKRS